MNMKLVILFGPPGGGKGTQAKRLVKEYNLVHISTGDLCRERAKITDPLGLEIKQLIEKGSFVPDQIIIHIFEETVKKHLPCKGFIFDGFPRNIAQVALFEVFLERNFPGIPLKLISIHVDEHELQERLLLRSQMENRKDDTPETISKRIHIFNTTTLPVIEFYQEKLDVPQIVGTGKQPQDVWEELKLLLN